MLHGAREVFPCWLADCLLHQNRWQLGFRLSSLSHLLFRLRRREARLIFFLDLFDPVLCLLERLQVSSPRQRRIRHQTITALSFWPVYRRVEPKIIIKLIQLYPALLNHISLIFHEVLLSHGQVPCRFVFERLFGRLPLRLVVLACAVVVILVHNHELINLFFEKPC